MLRNTFSSRRGFRSKATSSQPPRTDRLVEAPADYRVLALLVAREVTYRLALGDQAARLRHIAVVDGRAHRIALAMQILRKEYDKPLRIAALARRCGMSVSGFHHQFKTVAEMSPLQFQKQLRLHEARRLLVSGECDAATAGYRVGYRDPSHFSREYKRCFGEPPMRDVERLQGVVPGPARDGISAAGSSPGDGTQPHR